MKILIVNKSNNPMPSYATIGSAGMDLRANLIESVVIQPFERVLIPTGLFIELPIGTEGGIRPRSGLALKKGLTVLNAPGTIDSDYTDELKVILINLSDEPQTIEHGERIAQMVVAGYIQCEIEGVDELSASKTRFGGFGSTGDK